MNNMATVDRAINKSMIFRCSGSNGESQTLTVTFYRSSPDRKTFMASKSMSGPNPSAEFTRRSSHMHFSLINDSGAAEAAAATADIAPLIICFQPTGAMRTVQTLDITFTHQNPTSFLNVNGMIYQLSAAYLAHCLEGSSPCPFWVNPSSIAAVQAENAQPGATANPLAIRSLSPEGADQHSFHIKLSKPQSEGTVFVLRTSLISPSGENISRYLGTPWLSATSDSSKKPTKIKYLLPGVNPNDHIHVEYVERKRDLGSSVVLQELADFVKTTFDNCQRSAVFCLRDCTAPAEEPFRTTLTITPKPQKPLEYTATFAKRSEDRNAKGEHMVPTDPCLYLQNTPKPPVRVTLAHFKPDPEDFTADL